MKSSRASQGRSETGLVCQAGRRGDHVLTAGVLLMLAACAQAPPRMPSVAEEPVLDASAAFDQRVKAQFPIGTDLGALQAELTREQYTLGADPVFASPTPYSAVRKADNVVCSLQWTISWNAAGGKVTAIAGQYQSLCR